MNKTVQELLDEIKEANAEVGRWKAVVSGLERQLYDVRISNLLQSDFLVDDWRYGQNDDDEYVVHRWIKGSGEELYGLFNDSGSYINIVSDVRLVKTDRYHYYLDGTFDAVMRFIKKYNLKVDFSSLESDIETHQDEIELRKELLNKVKDKLNEH